MQDLNGPTARKKWNLPLKVALQKKNRNPPMNPGTDETAGVHGGGRQPIAGTDNCHRDRGHLGLEGSQWRPPPPPVVNQAVPRTTPSRRRVTRYGLVHNGWGVGRHCGRITGIAAGLCKRRCKNARASKEPEEAPPTEKPKQPSKTTKTTRTPKEKQPLGRGKHTEQPNNRVSGPKTKPEDRRKKLRTDGPG